MARRLRTQRRGSTPSYRFVPAPDPDAPVLLMLLPRAGQNAAALLAFGRMLHPGAALLGVAGSAAGSGAAGNGAATDGAAALLARALRRAGHGRELALLPVVAVGDRDGADLAAEALCESGAAVLAAAMLYRPGRRPTGVPEGLRGVPVLVVFGAEEGRDGAAGGNGAGTTTPVRDLAGALAAAGAAVTAVRLPAAADASLGALDAALGRAWLAQAFPEPAAPAPR